ncbi:cytochrome P450, partial [Blyttiomyces helicus]
MISQALIRLPSLLPHNWQQLVALTLALPVVYRAIKVTHFFLFSPIAKIPGPIGPIIFGGLYGFLQIARGKGVEMNVKRHAKYGPVTRSNMNTISVADPELIRDVLAVKDLPKSPLFQFVFFGRQTLLNTIDRDLHRKLRRILSPAFSIKHLAGLEPLFQSVVRSLFTAIDRHMIEGPEGQYGDVDIWRMMHLTGVEAIGETAFGTSFRLFE